MRIPTRERCQMCHRISAVGFSVPDWLWKVAVHPRWRNSVLCIYCFIEGADEKLLRWDRHITFYPVSKASHLEDVRGLQIPGDLAWGDEVDVPQPEQENTMNEQERALPLLPLSRFRDAVPETDCSGRRFSDEEREDIARYMQQAAEIQRDVDCLGSGESNDG